MAQKEMTREQLQRIFDSAKQAKNPYDVRKGIFAEVTEETIVPEEYISIFRKITRHCYSTVSHMKTDDGKIIRYHNGGYDGIQAEIDDRISMKYDNGDCIIVKDFFKAPADVADLYDSITGKTYEKKTGAGTWLYGTGSFDDIVKKYRRKRKLLKWDFDHVPVPGRKQDYPCNIHILTSYRLFFDFLATYPAGVKSFFKYKKGRSAEAGKELYDLQTVYSSKTKIAFLESFDEWIINRK